ncbi:hypothetical protein Nepgr_016190 [Nepenthes gracilis]|uniref:Uncharacterized protein n=1 Tax=Nepenthes gracilis TaxID=150966 RepID=A0AAD3SPC1_NEPGR|nr:hypothetical protein Nepgr_016190 [Nepenthes gracilis]
MANGGFIYISDLLAWPAGLSLSSEPESSSKEESSNKETTVRVGAEGSVGTMTIKEGHHSKASVLGTLGFLEVAPSFKPIGHSCQPWRVPCTKEETTHA